MLNEGIKLCYSGFPGLRLNLNINCSSPPDEPVMMSLTGCLASMRGLSLGSLILAAAAPFCPRIQAFSTATLKMSIAKVTPETTRIGWIGEEGMHDVIICSLFHIITTMVHDLGSHCGGHCHYYVMTMPPPPLLVRIS